MDDLREVIARAMRENMQVDASGLSPGVAHMYVQPEPDGFLRYLKQAGFVVVPVEPTEKQTVIEITPKMVEAGVEELRDQSFRTPFEEVVRSVYLMMEIERRA